MSRDLMHSSEIKDLVRDAYRHVPALTAAVAYKLYSAEELARVPEAAINRALGVANHLRFADIQPGDTILDIGCGGGIDTILAARRTGPTGKVIGLDFLPEMLQRTANAAQEAGLHNVKTLYGEMEAIPLPDSSVDLIISNGVINLSGRKARVMAECARVLRAGGELCVSDFTVDQDQLPADILTQPAAWAGCVAGALAEHDFIYKLQQAGFVDVRVLHREPVSIDDCALYPLFTDEVISLMRQLISPAEATGSRRLSRDQCSNPLIPIVTLPPASPVELLTACYSASARAYEQWWASAIHPAGVQLIDQLALHSADRILDLGAAWERCYQRFAAPPRRPSSLLRTGPRECCVAYQPVIPGSSPTRPSCPSTRLRMTL
jgi:arsenite methyltransferase